MRHINPAVLRGRPPDQRLRDVLDALLAEPYRPLDALYLYLLRQHAPQDPGDLAEWKKMIGLVCVPVYPGFGMWKRYFGKDNAFLQIYGKGPSDLEEALTPLQSLLHIEPGSGKPVNYHASFPDFAFNFERSGDFYVDPGLVHEHLVCTLIRSLNNDASGESCSASPSRLFLLSRNHGLQAFRTGLFSFTVACAITAALHDSPTRSKRLLEKSTGKQFVLELKA